MTQTVRFSVSSKWGRMILLGLILLLMPHEVMGQCSGDAGLTINDANYFDYTGCAVLSYPTVSLGGLSQGNFMFPLLESVNGRIDIMSSAITSVNGFPLLRNVTSLSITSSSSIQEVLFPSLTMSARSVSLQSLPNLVTISFPRLQTVMHPQDGTFSFTDLPSLTKVEFPMLTEVRYLLWRGLPVTNITLPNLLTVSAQLGLADCPNIIVYSAPKLATAWDITFFNLPILEKLDLSALVSARTVSVMTTGIREIFFPKFLRSGFFFAQNSLLQTINLTALANLTTSGGGFLALENPQLRTVSCPQLRYFLSPGNPGGAYIKVENNVRLQMIDMPRFEGWAPDSATDVLFYIYSQNAPQLKSLQFPSLSGKLGGLWVRGLHNNLQVIDLGGVTTVGQMDVRFRGDAGLVSRPAITANSLIEVISLYLSSDTASVSFPALRLVRSPGSGDSGINVYDNPGLTSVSMPLLLRTEKTDIEFRNNPLLQTIDMSSLQNVDGSLRLFNLIATSLTGFRALNSTSGSLTIAGSLATSITGFSNLTRVGTTLGIWDNTNLQSMTGFCKLKSAGSIEVARSPSLCCSAVAALFSQVTISGTMSVTGCSNVCTPSNNFTCDSTPRLPPHAPNGTCPEECTSCSNGVCSSCHIGFLPPLCGYIGDVLAPTIAAEVLTSSFRIIVRFPTLDSGIYQHAVNFFRLENGARVTCPYDSISSSSDGTSTTVTATYSHQTLATCDPAFVRLDSSIISYSGDYGLAIADLLGHTVALFKWPLSIDYWRLTSTFLRLQVAQEIVLPGTNNTGSFTATLMLCEDPACTTERVNYFYRPGDNAYLKFTLNTLRHVTISVILTDENHGALVAPTITSSGPTLAQPYVLFNFTISTSWPSSLIRYIEVYGFVGDPLSNVPSTIQLMGTQPQVHTPVLQSNPVAAISARRGFFILPEPDNPNTGGDQGMSTLMIAVLGLVALVGIILSVVGVMACKRAKLRNQHQQLIAVSINKATSSSTVATNKDTASIELTASSTLAPV